MKALILQHTLRSTPGSTLEWLQSRGIEHEILFMPHLKEFPSLKSFDLLFICGGGMNVDQEHIHPWLRDEKRFLRRAIDQKKKIVGLCLGGQLLAEVLGAKVGKHTDWEVGWHSVQLHTGQQLKVFEWHAYTFQCPPGAELIATNSQCVNQAFAYGTNVLGFQFHPEMTKEGVIERAQDPELPTDGFVQTSQQIMDELPQQEALQSWYFKTLDTWLGSAPKSNTEAGKL